MNQSASKQKAGAVNAAAIAEHTIIITEQQQLIEQQQEEIKEIKRLLQQQNSSSLSSTSFSNIPLTPEIITSLLRQRQPLPPPEPWKGIVGRGIVRWLEVLEGQHKYYGRTDEDKIITVVALLLDPALGEYNAEVKEIGEPKNYAELCDRLRKRWSPIEESFHVRKQLKALVAKGPAMMPPKYAESFRQLASQLEKDPQESLLFDFIEGLRPSFKTAIHNKAYTKLSEAIAHVTRMDATNTAYDINNQTHNTTSSTNSSRDADVDLSALGYLEPADRAACIAALCSEGLKEYDTSGSSSMSTSSSSSVPLQQQIAALQVQIAAAGLIGSNNKPFKKTTSSNKGRATNTRSSSSSPLSEIPIQLRQLRQAYGVCLRCGVHKFSAGENGHNARTCTATVDKKTLPQGPLPNFQ